MDKPTQELISKAALSYSKKTCRDGYTVREISPATFSDLEKLNATYNGQTELIQQRGGNVKNSFDKEKQLFQSYTFLKTGKDTFFMAQLIENKGRGRILTYLCTLA
ncbi:hypothetical protein DEIPH_ctg029orf0006 [Deinococcus phoenicis]|uniref:Uncharacterized protein n=2 Tax=Deinococcus phoenicis TaxID=1476583 RepID=A0A016QPU4_9DEIO|nr:hypothetical protein DEIPH_ctg029orf0006 [Deinococcus phoenicis]